jgi:thiamine pyrophosphate-dependent acetolactate synthase large subunit-like protein
VVTKPSDIAAALDRAFAANAPYLLEIEISGKP